MERFEPYLEHISGDTWCLVTPFIRLPLYMPSRKEAVLIDSGLHHHRQGILDALEREGVQITSLITSHFHRDHVGNHTALKERFHCTVYMTPFASALCGDPANVRGTGYESPLLTKARGGSVGCGADRVFYPGDKELQVQGGVFEILSLPGHCQEHVGIVTPDKVAYLSDTVLSRHVVNALRIPYCTDCTSDLVAKESVEKLNYPCYILAHNSVETEIQELARLNIENLKSKVDMVESLADRWLTMEALAARVMEHTGADLFDTGKVLGMARNTQVLVDHLVETQRLTHRVKDGFIEYIKA